MSLTDDRGGIINVLSHPLRREILKHAAKKDEPLSPDQIATVAAVVGGLLGGFQRTQTEPLETGTFRAGAAAGPRYGTVQTAGQVTT